MEIPLLRQLYDDGAKAEYYARHVEKVDFMASDDIERFYSANDKLREFENLGYPAGMRRDACGVLLRERPSLAWALVGTMQR